MRLSYLQYLIRSDLWRYAGSASFTALLSTFARNPGFKYCCWLRLSAYLREHRLLRFGAYHIAALILSHYSIKFGISIPSTTEIGSGLYIGHFGGIVVNGRAKIGCNCSISHGVTVGKANRGRNRGYPAVGDGVYFGPGAKVLGQVRVGNNVAVGANCVLTRDVPDNSVVVGIPGKVISDQGAEGYVTKTDYPPYTGPT